MSVDRSLAPLFVTLSALALTAAVSCSSSSDSTPRQSGVGGDQGGSSGASGTGAAAGGGGAGIGGDAAGAGGGAAGSGAGPGGSTTAGGSGGSTGISDAQPPNLDVAVPVEGGGIVPPSTSPYPVVVEPAKFVFSVQKPACTTPRTAVAVGAGSFADCPPADSTANTIDMYTTRKIWAVDLTQPIPTNDWWTALVINQYGGNLWSYPLVVRPQNYGIDVSTIDGWGKTDPNGFTAATNGKIQVSAAGFAPTGSPARKWSDWMVDFQMDGANGQQMIVSVVHGMPFTWVEAKSLPTLTLKAAVTASFDDAGTTVPASYKGDHVGITTGGKSYGIFAPPDSTFAVSATGVNVTFPGTAQYLAIGALTAPGDLKTYTPYAYAIPRDTHVSWYYVPEAGQVRTMWEITAQNLRGDANTDVLQGFIPHHYAKTGRTFEFNGKEYFTPRGKLKLATGKKFEIVYRFNGMLPMLPKPEVVAGAANPYQDTRMKQLLDEYSTITAYGGDTYWGGKDVEKFAMYAFMSKLTGNTATYDKLAATLRGAMVDWLTYTPGEKEHFFAYYWNWKALIGMQPSYWSEQFTDNHFHYGYFAMSAAILSMLDPDFRDKYGPMATMVVKQYANYNRDDKSFPMFRTFDPWGGHSNAGGFSDPNSGNNQESSSEAMQSWGGVFLLGAALGNDAMRDAGAFGWAIESQAINEYYFDRQGTNFPPEWTHMIATPIRDDHIGYWKYFQGDIIWEHAIQWLPMNTSLYYLGENYDYAQQEYTSAMAENPGKTEGSWGSGLANVVLSFKQIADPDGAAKTFDDLWTANNAAVRDKDTSGKTYWFTHSNRRLGRIAWDWHTSCPTAQVFENAATKEYTAVGFNPTAAAATCKVYKGTTEAGQLTVPPGELAMDRKPLP